MSLDFFPFAYPIADEDSPFATFCRYDFFQTLCKFLLLVLRYHFFSMILTTTFLIAAIVGGLLLLVNMGPGDYSVDAKKRM